jgi:hypothetical protein
MYVAAVGNWPVPIWAKMLINSATHEDYYYRDLKQVAL